MKGLAGLTLMNHPDNPNHPTAFHVRDEGCMFACMSLTKPIDVGDAKPLHVRCGVWVHEGVPTKEQCEAMWKRFAALALPDTRVHGRGTVPLPSFEKFLQKNVEK